MEVSQQRGHLLLVESACKAGHHAAPLQHILLDGLVGDGYPTGKSLLVEEPVQIGWTFFSARSLSSWQWAQRT